MDVLQSKESTQLLQQILVSIISIGFDVDLVDAGEKKTPATLAKFGAYDVVLASSTANSISGSPFVDKKLAAKGKIFGGIGTSGAGSGSKALLLFGNASASPATSIRWLSFLFAEQGDQMSFLIAQTAAQPIFCQN
jgi:hypothetical protein